MTIFNFFNILFIILLIKSSHGNTSMTEEEDSNNGTVLFELQPISLVSITPKTMDFTVEFYTLVSWRNSKFNEASLNKKKCIYLSQFCKLEPETTYVPQLQFTNCKTCKNDLLETADIYYDFNNKTFVAYIRNTIKFNCKFDMSKYPFDTQNCTIAVHFVSDNREIDFKLDKWHSMYAPPDYEIINISKRDLDCTYITSYKSECVNYEFKFRHKVERHIFLVYLPSLLIVIMSWISFWLDVSATAPRVALGLTSMLTLATHFNTAQQNLPATSDFMALDVWMLFCIMTVFASMIEFAIVHHKCRKLKGRIQPSNEISPDKNCLSLFKIVFERTTKPTFFDEISRILFPLIFSFFILLYYIHYAA